MTDCCDNEYSIQPTLVKDPGDTKPLEVDFFPKCAVYWQKNNPIVADEYCRPITPNGLAAKCTTPGTTGGREPLWPKTISSTVTDGTAVWTMFDAGVLGVNAISAPSVVSDPTGLTIANVTVLESFKLTLDVSGGADQDDYDLVYSMTVSGKARVFRQKVKIRRR